MLTGKLLKKHDWNNSTSCNVGPQTTKPFLKQKNKVRVQRKTTLVGRKKIVKHFGLLDKMRKRKTFCGKSLKKKMRHSIACARHFQLDYEVTQSSK